MMKNKTKDYYPYFDILRILLASIVALRHDYVIPIPYVSNLAVQVFFALSGWLIGGILLKLKKEQLPQFFFNRIIRIWIPYFFGLFLIVFLSFIKDNILTYKWLEIVSYKIFFVYNIFGTPQIKKYIDAMPLKGTATHFWSVNAEEQFYLVAPLILVLCLPKFGRSIILWLNLALLLLYFNIYASISFGVLAAVVANKYPSFHQSKLAKLILIFMLIISSLSFTTSLPYPFIAPFFSISVVLLLAQTGRRNPYWAFLGGISYPMYLNHWIGVFAANFIFRKLEIDNFIFRKSSAYLISLVVAAILYTLIDKKMLNIRDKLYTPERGKLAMYASYTLVIIGVIIGLSFKYLFPIEFS